MNKEERIARYGVDEYIRRLAQNNAWNKAHPTQVVAASAASHAERERKGGTRYAKYLKNEKMGLRGERNCIRAKHRGKWRRVKRIIAPGSQIHHEWIPGTAKYRGVALVEADQHMDGGIDVIHILEGNITLLTEDEIRSQGVEI